MPVKDSSSYDSTNNATVFKTTGIMSSYLIAFVVSDFKKLTNEAGNFTVYAKPNSINDGKLALKKGAQLLGEMEIFTGIQYDLEKMDQIAIPDFSAGAMENWGLVTYRLGDFKSCKNC